MFFIKPIDKIANVGLKLFDSQYQISNTIDNPHAILVRSSKLTESDLIPSLYAIGRAGIGVNNIPVSLCTQKGIVVFNTPGANANGVKELVLLGMLLGARNIIDSVGYVQTLKDAPAEEFDKLVEANKSQYKGFELKNKRLGVVGLGSIGIMIANDCLSLGMHVEGYDPYISVERAWSLSRNVKKASTLEKMLSESDFLTLHVPLTDQTRKFMNKEKFAHIKKGCILLNFSRGEIVDEADLLEALDQRIIAKYITDFPSKNLVGHEHVICIPHLGASTHESEDNCATMVVEQIKDYLENGNIKNSVNFPECSLERNIGHRLLVANQNVPNMLGQIGTVLAEEKLNIINMVNKSKGDIAYNIVDVSNEITDAVLSKIQKISGVIMQRIIKNIGG